MKQPARQDPLVEALSRLPRHRPAETFTQEVLAATRSRIPASRRKSSPLIWATAAALILICLAAVGFEYQRQRAQQEAYRLQVEQLKSRYQELLDEVASVRGEVEDPDTRLYLGGDEKVDLMLDLGQVRTLENNPQNRRAVRPAALDK